MSFPIHCIVPVKSKSLDHWLLWRHSATESGRTKNTYLMLPKYNSDSELKILPLWFFGKANTCQCFTSLHENERQFACVVQVRDGRMESNSETLLFSASPCRLGGEGDILLIDGASCSSPLHLPLISPLPSLPPWQDTPPDAPPP